MDMINNINKKLDVKYGCSHNVEQIPGESTAVKLAAKDRLLNINDKYDLYSNQFIPLTIDANLLDRLEIQGKFDKHFSGGSIAHINLEKRIEKVELMENLIESAIKKGVIYFAVNYVINSCDNNHITIGSNVKSCSVCQSKNISQFTRVVGFLTNVKDWNETRREKDFKERKFYQKI